MLCGAELSETSLMSAPTQNDHISAGFVVNEEQPSAGRRYRL